MRRSPALPAAVAVVALAALTAGVLQPGFVRALDWHVHLWVVRHLRGDAAHAVAMLAAWLGQRGVVVVPLLAAALLTARRRRSLRPLVLTGAVLVGVALSVQLFKVGVGRVAPGTGHDGVHEGGLSYPSGHVVNALVCWSLVLEFAAGSSDRAARLLSMRRRRTIPAVLALAAGAGMMALDYHWLSDSIAGALVGVIILSAVLAVGPVRDRPAVALSPTTPPEPARPAPSA